MARSRRLACFTIAASLVCTRVASALTVTGPICQDTTWHLADSPVVAQVSVFVGGEFCPGVFPTLTIEPGVEVRFNANRLLEVTGTLVARGTAETPILFTSNVASPAPGDWGGIQFLDTSTDAAYDGDDEYVSGSILEHVIVEYAGRASRPGVVAARSAAPALLHLLLRLNSLVSSGGGGLYVDGPVPVRLVSPRIVFNAGYDGAAIALGTSGWPVEIRNAEIVGNLGPPSFPGALHGISVGGTPTSVTITDTVIANNGFSSLGFSTGLWVANTPEASITRVQVADNGNSDGMTIGGSQATVTLCDVFRNDAVGVKLSSSTIDLSHSSIQLNGGTGVIMHQSTLDMTETTIRENGQGGMYLSGTSTLSDNCIARNGPRPEETGGIFFAGGTATLRQNTITDNESDAIAQTSAHLDLQQNNILDGVPYFLRNDPPRISVSVKAQNVWWGTTNGGIVDEGIFDCFDDDVDCTLLAPLAAGPIAGAPDIVECGTPGTTTTTTTSTTIIPPTTLTSSTTTSTVTTLPTTTTTSASPVTSTTTSTPPTTSTTTSTSTTTKPSTTSPPTSTSTTTTTVTTTVTTTTLPATTTTTTPTPTTTTTTTLPPITSTTTTSPTTTTTQAPATTTTTVTTPPTTTLPTTTEAPTTTSSTTTTLPPAVCGNGVVEASEACDPRAPGSQGCCNPSTCLPLSAGNSCGLEQDACGTPVCDGGGRCVTRPALVGLRCREIGSIGPCDPGAICGTEPYCPSADTASGCEALDFAYAPRPGKLSFRCKSKRPNAGSVKCAADLIAAPGDGISRASGRRPRQPRIAFDALPASDCTGPQFDTALPKKLVSAPRGELARVIVKRINKGDRAFFAPGKTVCVRVRFTASAGYSHTRLYNIVVPPGA